ncbi:MAG: ATP-grasp domain-containing protein [Acidobacteria bacterium]|nr:ATP-grasp domain-containing protein [Acidobacteriota bacterium]
MIRRLLIANRGEIARRIIHACREIGIESIAVHSDVDAGAPHVAEADRAIAIGAAAPADSYLSIPRILDAAVRTGADAVHPGYGVLAENPGLAAACEAGGITFVGPPSRVIAAMGSKIAARQTMAASGVSVVPGETPADQSDDGLCQTIERIGFPALVKASAGGGGKGMRRVDRSDAVRPAVQAARREAATAFGDGTLYVERLLERPRHVEVQVFGDRHGHLVHLFERECSTQRRHQKIIEESPSPALTPALRARLAEAGVAAARAAGYVNAGTVEFLLEGEGDRASFYFLEMNTRLQVEHPVTEAVTGLDLVRAQLLVASGAPLPWSGSAITQRGHAVEARIYAEDPSNDFLPQAGRLLLYREPRGPGIRIDSGVIEGSRVPVHYDPLIAKVIASAESRPAAIARLVQALRSFPILGVATNVPFLLRVLLHPAFEAGAVDTAFLDREMPRLVAPAAPEPPLHVRAAIAAHLAATGANQPGAPAPRRPDRDPWNTIAGWRN